jgi:hypothetical protein
MDFSRLAEDFLHVDLQAVAFFFLLFIVVPVVAVWAQRQIATRRRGRPTTRAR